MDAFLKEHGIDDVQEMLDNYYKDIEDNEDAAIVGHDLFQRYKDKSAYGVVSRSANNWYLCDYFGDGHYKIRESFQIEGNEHLLNEFEDAIRDRTFRSTADIDRLLEKLARREGQHNDDRSDVQGQGAVVENAVVDSRQLEEGHHPIRHNGKSAGDLSFGDIQELRISRPQKDKPSEIGERFSITSSLDGGGDRLVFGKRGSACAAKEQDGRIVCRRMPGKVVFYTASGLQQVAFNIPNSKRSGALNITFYRTLTEHEQQEIESFLSVAFKNVNDWGKIDWNGIAARIDGIMEDGDRGELLGFYYDGEIYLDDTKLDQEMPIHEYVHLWGEALRRSNPELWAKGNRCPLSVSTPRQRFVLTSMR